jgi:hypothetical protein
MLALIWMERVLVIHLLIRPKGQDDTNVELENR